MPAGRDLREPGFAPWPSRSSSTAAGKTAIERPAGAWPRRFASRHRHIQKSEDFGPFSR
jgi:hypothetical protein